VFEKSRDARLKQYELREAEEKLSNAQGDDKKRAQRTFNRVKLELDDLKKKIGILPPMPVPISYAAAGGATITGTAAFAMLEQDCKKHIMLSSVDPTQPSPSASLNARRMRNPLLHLVQGSPPRLPSSGTSTPEPTNEEIATRIVDQIKNEIKQEFAGDLKEYSDLNRIKPEDRTPAQNTRLKQIQTKIGQAIQNKWDELTGVGEFANKEQVGLVLQKLSTVGDVLLGKGEMPQIDPPTIQIAPSTGGTTTGPVGTRLSNKKGAKFELEGPGTLTLRDGVNGHDPVEVYVEKDGTYDKQTPIVNFKPVEFMFESDKGKWIWQNGQWQRMPAGTAKSSASEAGPTTEGDRPMSEIPFHFNLPHRDTGGMTQIDPLKSDQPLKPISGNFGKLPEGVVPKSVDLVDSSGQTIRLDVGPDGKFEGQVPAAFTPVKQTLYVIGNDGKPYIANYEIINGEFRPVGKFQQAGPTDEELHKTMTEHGTGYAPMRDNKSPLEPAPSKADGGPGTTGQTTGTPQPKKVSFHIQATPIPRLASAPQSGDDSSLTFAITDEWTMPLNFTVKLGQPWIDYDDCGATVKKTSAATSTSIKGTYNFVPNTELQYTPRVHVEYQKDEGEDYAFTNLWQLSPSLGGKRWAPNIGLDYAYKSGADNIPEATVTFKPTSKPWLQSFNDLWTNDFNDTAAREQAGPTAQDFGWQYHGQALGEGRIGFSHWSTTEEIHDTFVHEDAFSRNWEFGEKDSEWEAAPVSSLHPAHWPHTDAFALPRVEIRMEAP